MAEIKPLSRSEREALIKDKAGLVIVIMALFMAITTYFANMHSGAVMKNSKPPVLKCYIKYNDDDWKWNDEGYLYYDGKYTVDYNDKTTPIIKGTKFI